MSSRLLLTLLLACSLTHADGLVGGGAGAKAKGDYDEPEVPGEAMPDLEMFNPASVKIPPWKLTLVAGTDKGLDASWWEKYGFASVTDAVASALWGHNYPAITGSPGQNTQKCPIIKLPDKIVMSAKHISWDSLYGEWQTTNAVKVASFEQSYMGLGFKKDIKRLPVTIRDPSTQEVAAKTRYFSSKEMRRMYDWKEPIKHSGFAESVKNLTALKDNTFEDLEHDWNLAIFDCRGTLMFVVKQMWEFPKYLKVYSRNGELLAETSIGQPVLKYEFIDPKTNYALADAEAPGIGANITAGLIPEAYKVHHILPVEIEFQRSLGHKNTSALIETEYRWVLAAAIQALTIFKAPQDPSDDVPWKTLTIVETVWAVIYVSIISGLLGAFVLIYFCVYPTSYQLELDHYGKIAENPHFVTPELPGHRDDHKLAATTRLGNENMYNYGSYGYR